MSREGGRQDFALILRTITLLISKPLNFGFMILGFVMIGAKIQAILNQEPHLGIHITYIVLGVFLVIYCGYQVFFVSLKKQLQSLQPKSSHTSASKEDNKQD